MGLFVLLKMLLMPHISRFSKSKDNNIELQDANTSNIPFYLFVKAQACSGDFCFPTVNTALFFGNNDRANCHTLLDSIDTDMNTDIFIAGRTQSMSLIRGGSYVSCLDTSLTGQFAGYVTRF